MKPTYFDLTVRDLSKASNGVRLRRLEVTSHAFVRVAKQLVWQSIFVLHHEFSVATNSITTLPQDVRTKSGFSLSASL